MPSQTARSPEEQCLAFTKDHRRCRLQRDEGSKSCPYHKDYFLHWLETHRGFHHVISSKRHIEEYRFQICNKHVHIPESYIASLAINYQAYYEFLVKETGCSSLVNRRCLKYCIDNLSWTIFSEKNLARTKRLFNSLAHLFTDVESILFCFTLFWKEMVEIFRFYEAEDAVYMKRFEQVFYSPVWRPIIFNAKLWYTIQTIWEENQRRETEQSILMNRHFEFKEQWTRERFQDMLYEMTIFHQKKMKERVQPFKEDLMAAAWHPKRVEKWIDAYGIESMDDM